MWCKQPTSECSLEGAVVETLTDTDVVGTETPNGALWDDSSACFDVSSRLGVVGLLDESISDKHFCCDAW